MTKSRLVDPVHFFNARGKSILTMDDQFDRIGKLEAKNAQLQRLVETLRKRLAAANGALGIPGFSEE